MVLLSAPQADRWQLVVSQNSHVHLVARIPDVTRCGAPRCAKPIIASRDGKLCWQHAVNGSSSV